MARSVKKSVKVHDSKEDISNDNRDFGREVNPLFVEVILEIILNHLKESNKSISLGEYRLVCKFWDHEIIKMIRRETHVQVHRILTPYPDGYGWSTVKGANKFRYKLPHPQIYPIENVEVVFTNRSYPPFFYQTPDEKFKNWFKLMGHQVKSLIFPCFLRTSQRDDYRILERILKEWCPNLERLTLKDIRLIEGLVFTSWFEDPSTEIISSHLKELTIATTSIQDNAWPKPDENPNLAFDPRNLNRFIYNHGLPSTSEKFPEVSNSAGVKVIIPKEHNTNSKLPDLSTIIPANFFPDFVDGGILGQLMKCTCIKKLRFYGHLKSINREHLVALFHYRRNNWKNSLNHLEIDLIDFERIDEFANHLVVLAKAGFPIATLKLTKCIAETTEREIEDTTRFLSMFSETLKHLEFRVIGSDGINKLVCPYLPKLKTFEVDNIFLYQLSGVNLAANAPNLEKCYLKAERWSRDLSGNLDSFFSGNYSNVSNKQLKDFRLIGDNVTFSGVQASNLFDWFPNVKRMELVGIVEDNIGMAGLLQKLGNSEVTDLKMSWSKTRNTTINDNINNDTALILETGKLQNLRTLELTYANDKLPLHVMPTAFRDGFGQLSHLKSLKLTHFGVYLDEKPEIINYLDHIPAVQLVKMAYLRRRSTRHRRNKKP